MAFETGLMGKGKAYEQNHNHFLVAMPL